MDPEFDITLNSTDHASKESAKGHFLNSLGLGERDLLGTLENGRREEIQDEGVVLSSIPDDLGFSGPGAAPDRGVAQYSQRLQEDRETISAISLPVEDEPQPEPEEPRSEGVTLSPITASEDPDESLHLQCPECHGSLVLKRVHLGIEGACVWCHTPIVAAESGRDGQVRVFPILGQAPPTSTDADTPKVETTSLQNTHQQVSEPAPSAIEASNENVTPPIALPGVESAPAFSGFGALPPTSTPSTGEPVHFATFGFSGSPAATPEPTSVPTPQDDPALVTPDLESLYETGGFLAAMPSATAPVPTGFGETLAKGASPEPEAETRMPGFGAFLQNVPTPEVTALPSEKVQPNPITDAPAASGFFTPTPWGPPPNPAKPAATTASITGIEASSAAPAPTAMPGDDDAPTSLPAGFGSGFGSPAPAAETPEPAAPTWEAAFGSLKDVPVAPAAAPASGPLESTGFGGGFLNAGFAEPSPTPKPQPLAAPAPAPAFETGFSLQPSTAAKVQEEAKSLEETRSFAPPFHAFATGSSTDEESSSRNLFGDPSPGGSLWGAGGSSDDAPTSFVPMTPLATFGESTPLAEPEPLFTAEEHSDPAALPSPPPATTASMFADFRVADPDEPAAAPEPPVQTGPPALPTSANPDMTLNTTGTPAAMPQVTSQPLGAKPKPKVRKGFVVLMVVIVGFASGAALASFVLPVEQYVSAARSFMESKFGGASGVAIPQMPMMPATPEEMPSSAEPAAPVDSQP